MILFFNPTFSARFNIQFEIDSVVRHYNDMMYLFTEINNLQNFEEEYYIAFSDRPIDLKKIDNKIKRNARNRGKKIKNFGSYRAVRAIDKIDYEKSFDAPIYYIKVRCDNFDEENDYGEYFSIIFAHPHSHIREYSAFSFEANLSEMDERTIFNAKLRKRVVLEYKRHTEKRWVKSRAEDIEMRKRLGLRYASKYHKNEEWHIDEPNWETGSWLEEVEDEIKHVKLSDILDGGIFGCPIRFDPQTYHEIPGLEEYERKREERRRQRNQLVKTSR